MTKYSGYKATQVINARLEDEGLKTIPPQMTYTYIKKGYIDSVVVEGKKFIEEDVLLEWIEEFVGKRHAKEQRKADAIEEELQAV